MAASTTLSSSSIIIVISLLLSLSEAKDFLVGGKYNAWEIPSSSSETLNRWAEKSRFEIGDSLVWKYDGAKDSVLEVSREDYMNCNVANPIAAHKDGNTVVRLERSGPFYFISGAPGHCDKGQKLIVVVLAARKRHGISPAPSPIDFFDGAPAIAPTSGSSRLAVLMTGFLSGFVVFWGLVL